MRNRLRPTLATLATGALLLGLAACGSADEPAAGSTSAGTPTEAPDGAFPVTLDNAFGSTTIEARPERVATVNWGNHDVPIALGVVPVGMAKVTYGDDDTDGVLPWTKEALDALGAQTPVLFDETDGVDFEGVSDVSPDVVLAAYSGLTQEDWTTLSGIAPTVAYPKLAWGTSWRDAALINGEALGLKAEAEAKIADVEDQIAAALAERPDVAGKTVVYTWIDPSNTSTVTIYSTIDARVQLMDDLGMSSADSVQALSGGDEFYVSLSAEQIDQIADADILVTYGDDSTLAMLQADPLLSTLPAIARGSVVVLPNDAPISAATSGPTILSVPWVLDDYLDLFEAAAQKVA